MNQLLPKYFGFDPATTTIRTEIIAGVSTFLTMAYILAVNPAILGITGMDKGALFATTAITSGIATLIMALYARCPSDLHRVWVSMPSLPIPFVFRWGIPGSLR